MNHNWPKEFKYSTIKSNIAFYQYIQYSTYVVFKSEIVFYGLCEVSISQCNKGNILFNKLRHIFATIVSQIGSTAYLPKCKTIVSLYLFVFVYYDRILWKRDFPKLDFQISMMKKCNQDLWFRMYELILYILYGLQNDWLNEMFV